MSIVTYVFMENKKKCHYFLVEKSALSGAMIMVCNPRAEVGKNKGKICSKRKYFCHFNHIFSIHSRIHVQNDKITGP